MRGVFLRSILAASALFTLGNATTAFAQLPLPTPTSPPITLPAPVTVTLSISGNEALGTFDIGGIGADLKIVFENVVGLTSSALDVTATIVDPLDPTLLSRLPGNG